ncbi:hypothetical protein BDW22DRAFT_501918 [Trametopsis cervina]|nr:hypothetical protein BDW22DRAFT_501918 [Trametopsis cervina]
MIPTTSHRVATPERPRLPPTARPDSPTISTSNTSKRKEVRLRFSSPITSSDFSMYPSHTRSISSAAQSAHETGFGSSQRVDDLRTGLPSSRAKVANVEQPSIPTLRLAELASGSVLPPPSTFFSPPISSFDTQPEPSEQSLVGSRSAPSIQGSSPFLTKLCDAVHTRLIELNSKTPSPPPKTFAELAERMKPAVQFAEAVERGEYASFGIVPVKQSRNRGEAPSDFEG